MWGNWEVGVELYAVIFSGFSLLCALPFQAGPGLQWRQSSLSWALFFICSYSMPLLFIQFIIVAFCLPRVLVHFILSSKTVHTRDSFLNTCPNQLFCLCRMVFIKLLFSSTMSGIVSCRRDMRESQNLQSFHISKSNQKVNLYSASSIKKFSDAPPTHKHAQTTMS